MNEIKEINEEDFKEYGKGIDSTEQDELDAAELQSQQDMYPPEGGLGGIYALFGQVISQEDVSRVANLSPEEMGVLPFTVRGSKWVSKLGYSFHHKMFGDFFADQANIIMETSLSKDGFLIQTFVTSKKQTINEHKEQHKVEDPEVKKKKWDMFSKKK